MKATRDEQPKVQAQSFVSLGRIGDAHVYGRLLELLRDTAAVARKATISTVLPDAQCRGRQGNHAGEFCTSRPAVPHNRRKTLTEATSRS
jgi:hypothetical protein